MPGDEPASAGRRNIILGLAGTAGVAGVVDLAGMMRRLPANTSIHSTGTKLPLAAAPLDQWEAEMGATFYLRTEAGRLPLTLATVRPLPVVGTRPAHVRAQPFQATFQLRGTGPLPMVSASYPVSHKAYGTFTLFLEASGNGLRATFN